MSTTEDRTSARGGDISTERPDARRIDRYEAPNYLARYRDRQTRNAAAAADRFAADVPAGSAQGPTGAAPAARASASCCRRSAS